MTDFIPKYSIRNSCELIDKIKDFTIHPNSILISFDVVGLFPNVPVSPTLQHVKRTLLDVSTPPPPLVVDEYMKFLTLCLFPDFFKYGDAIYTVPDGAPMGSPLAL